MHHCFIPNEVLAACADARLLLCLKATPCSDLSNAGARASLPKLPIMLSCALDPPAAPAAPSVPCTHLLHLLCLLRSSRWGPCCHSPSLLPWRQTQGVAFCSGCAGSRSSSWGSRSSWGGKKQGERALLY